MRLLNVNTMKLEEFVGKPPRYSILSHCWDKKEVTFQHLTSSKFRRLKGYQKLANCCRLSKDAGFQYTWIDTCCIDKTSSAELSEAINSMFRWYQEAKMCYAYLDDVGDDDPNDPESTFRTSRWFSRGWTLQELIAPSEVEFLNEDWEKIGTKESLLDSVARTTGIDEKVLSSRSYSLRAALNSCSVACRMSWAYQRRTTREEDMAYCLMGIFGVNMSLIYGEGAKAFIRLQKEILNETEDSSILAWHEAKDDDDDDDRRRYSTGPGILAPSPWYFRDSRDVEIDHTWDLRYFPSSPRCHLSFAQANLELQAPILRRRDLKHLIGSDETPGLVSHHDPEDDSALGVIREEYERPRGRLLVVVLDCKLWGGHIVVVLESLQSGQTRRLYSEHLFRLPTPLQELPEPSIIRSSMAQEFNSASDIYQIYTHLGGLNYIVSTHSPLLQLRHNTQNEWSASYWQIITTQYTYLVFQHQDDPKGLPDFVVVIRHYEYELGVDGVGAKVLEVPLISGSMLDEMPIKRSTEELWEARIVLHTDVEVVLRMQQKRKQFRMMIKVQKRENS